METIQLEIAPQDFGLDQVKGNELLVGLPQIRAERSILAAQYEDVIKMDVDDPQASKEARALRLRIKTNRTQGIEKWHKNSKEIFLRGGQFLDAVKRREVTINQDMEDRLAEIEKYHELQEQKRLEEIAGRRKAQLEPYNGFYPVLVNLGTMTDEDFAMIFEGAVAAKEKKEREERQEREAREKEKAETALKDERMKRLNRVWDFLTFEEMGTHWGRATEEEYQTALLRATGKKQEKEEEDQRIAAENQRLREEAEAKQKELDAIKAKEEQARIEQEAKEEAARKEEERKANAPDIEKLKELVNKIDDIKMPIVSSEWAKRIVNETKKDLRQAFVTLTAEITTIEYGDNPPTIPDQAG